MNETLSQTSKPYTTKQMGDACEMLVAAEMTLAGIPAMKAPDYWPGYDVIAQPPNKLPQRISVKSRTYKIGSAFVNYRAVDVFDWLAIVILPSIGQDARRVYILPRERADAVASVYASPKMAGHREFRIDRVSTLFRDFENNFRLDLFGRAPLE